MEFKNNTTGQIINIVDIDLKNKLIVYHLFENSIFYKKGKAMDKDTIAFNPNLTTSKNVNLSEFIDFIAEESIKESFPGFEVVENIDLWDIKKGDTNKNTKFRVFIPATTITKHIFKNNDLDMFLTTYVKLSNSCLRGKFGILQYLEDLTESQRLILESYDGIIVEDKPSNK